ncbi:MAG: DUF3368 domain-containing protein [Segetibacter sp.]
MQPPQFVIADTSCLIIFKKIDEFNLLQRIFETVVITGNVASEFNEHLPAWIKIQNPKDIKYQKLLETTLGKGESSSIVLALEKPHSILVIDEMKGTSLAEQLGLNITGTLGVLIQAKMKGHISALKPILDLMGRTNFRLSERLITETLKKVSE